MGIAFRRAALAGAFAVGLIGATPAASATEFGFAADPDLFIDQSIYQGFFWSGGFPDNSWVNGTVLPLHSGVPDAPLGYAWSNAGINLEMSAAGAGTFSSQSFDVYGNAVLYGGTAAALTVTGWRDGQQVDSLTIPQVDDYSVDAYRTVTLGWTNIDAVTFSGDQEENLLYTNFSVSDVPPVPEPSDAALALAGLGLLGALSRKRRRFPGA